MDDDFETPDQGRKGEVKIERGRYKLPDPVTGKPRLWTRATTLANTIKDTYHLDRWNERMVAKGIAIRPDLAMLAANLDVTDDREPLQELAERAKEAAGANVGANMGTALHEHAQLLDGGMAWDTLKMGPATAATLATYRRTLANAGILMEPSLMERVVCCHELGVCGRLDRILTSSHWDLPRIGDLKTQKTMDFGGLEIAMQMSIYANADYIWNEDTAEWEDFPQMDLKTGLVMHLPVNQATCKLYQVDLDNGWRCVRLAMTVREARRRGKGMVSPYVNDGVYRARIMAAETVDDLSRVWQDATTAGEWNKDLEVLGLARREQIKQKEITA